ncbi:MAG: polysaccharide deacetylase family protein [Bacteroidia bacterium]|nr:polysaccharide deacetylase family protein [Bacteroidota bacterium]MBP6513081.1 polysaccharide deacetylase family protein [Bacteroidia bacterium]MBP7245254.1 polysaccharide deacetylase family protein [Bacteroidia bacterium]
MAHELLVYTAKKSSRLRYIFDLMLRNLLGLEITFTDKADVFRSHVGPKLSYCDHQLADEPFFFASRLLFEKGIEDQQINVFEWKGIPAFFGTHPKYIIPFDLFAASFYLVSRYEEYLPHIKDDHMRFSPQQSLAYQKNFLNKPLVNIYAQELKQILHQYYPELQFKDTHYRYISTFDIDSAYAYHEKGIVRHVGAFALSLFKFNFRKIVERFSVLFGWEKDPYDTYEWQLEISKKYNLKTIYFFLVGDYGEFDKNIPLEGSRLFQTLIKSIADYAEVGVHPSYNSNSNRDQLRKEIKRLNKVLKRQVIKSRQHYLKVTFPETFRNLLENDITEDYSMGYASEIGFRASICTPFNFYDLDLDVSTKLSLVPFMLMDGTMKDYMKLNPQESVLRAKGLIDEVKAVNGTFVTLWHNQSVNDKEEWEGWRDVYEQIVAYAVKDIPIKSHAHEK